LRQILYALNTSKSDFAEDGMYPLGQDSLAVKPAITAPTREIRTAFLIAAGLASAATGALIVHARTASAFRRRIDAMIARLRRPSCADTTSLPLPDIVRSFAERAVSSTAAPATVRLHQNGEMRNGPNNRWRSLTATQTIAVRQPGFVWLARMRIGSLFPATILDAYGDEIGLLEVRLFDSVRLARISGPDLSRGELMRYLAELPWAPHAILHNRHLSWHELNRDTVEVSAPCVGGSAKVRLLFEAGDIAGIEADDRPRAAAGRTIPTPWRGHFFDYRTIGGCRIPTRAVVSWVLDDGPFDCWRGTITHYELR
jgi:hypothetical protein